MKKAIIIGSCSIIFLSATAAARAATPDIFLSGGLTNGSYRGSFERDDILIQRLDLSLIPDYTSGLTLHLQNLDLRKKRRFTDLNQQQAGVSGYKAFPNQALGGYLGGRLDLHYLSSEDEATDQGLITYLAATYMTRDGGLYLDAGYTRSDYNLNIDQYTATLGFSFLNGRAWSQTRVYYIDPEERVQGWDTTLAVEQSLTYWTIPQVMSTTLRGLLGRRVFGYDPATFTVYNLSDVQEGGLGLSVNYQLTPALGMLADVAYEKFNNQDDRDDYSAIYGTLGVTYRF
jgi:hypothetical protein